MAAVKAENIFAAFLIHIAMSSALGYEYGRLEPSGSKQCSSLKTRIWLMAPAMNQFIDSILEVGPS